MTAASRWTRFLLAAALGSAGALVAIASTPPSAGAVTAGYNGRIAFNHGTGAVNTVLPDGSGTVNVDPSVFAVAPSYSADGTLTYMTSARQVIAVAPDGTKTNLFTSPGLGTTNDVSPDGTNFLVPTRETDTRLSSIGIIARDGSNLRQPFAGDAYNEGRAAWFPDGQHIAFLRSSADFSTTALYTANIDGSELTLVPTDNDDGYTSIGDPSVSPDGTKLVFPMYNTTTQLSEVTVVNLDGTNMHHFPVNGVNPTFAPDGTQIAFQGGTTAGIWAMNADGTNVHQITSGNDTYPVWQRLASAPTTTTTTSTTFPEPTNIAPVAVMTIGRVGDTRGLSVSAARSTDNDGSIASYQWNWGDNTPATKTSAATHTYAAPGIYTVKLGVIDNKGAKGQSAVFVRVATSTDKVKVPAYPTPTPVAQQNPNLPPRAVLTIAWPTTPLSVYASAAGSFDPDGTIVDYLWTWGDNQSSDGRATWATHTYKAPSTHRISLAVADTQNGVAAAPVWVRVS
ncbi:MAG TPA: PKD domain-containing protein [Acidimicrobiales bacterium]|nr:PKD domain-containing protein [Acidimicrobiales bacterium]